MIAVDANGVVISADWVGSLIGNQMVQQTFFGFGNGVMNAMTARPITIQVFDITATPPFGNNNQAIYDNIVAQGAPLLIETDYDPVDDLASCSVLPLGANPTSVPANSTWAMLLLISLLLLVTYRSRGRRFN